MKADLLMRDLTIGVVLFCCSVLRVHAWDISSSIMSLLRVKRLSDSSARILDNSGLPPEDMLPFGGQSPWREFFNMPNHNPYNPTYSRLYLSTLPPDKNPNLIDYNKHLAALRSKLLAERAGQVQTTTPAAATTTKTTSLQGFFQPKDPNFTPYRPVPTAPPSFPGFFEQQVPQSTAPPQQTASAQSQQRDAGIIPPQLLAQRMIQPQPSIPDSAPSLEQQQQIATLEEQNRQQRQQLELLQQELLWQQQQQQQLQQQPQQQPEQQQQDPWSSGSFGVESSAPLAVVAQDQPAAEFSQPQQQFDAPSQGEFSPVDAGNNGEIGLSEAAIPVNPLVVPQA